MKAKTFGILAVAVFLTAMGLEAQAKAQAKGQLSGVVNINEASVAQLTMLPGVGPKRAEAIREYAGAHPFKTVDELKAIKGIGDKGLEKLRPYVTLSGPTTAKWLKTPTAQVSHSVNPLSSN
jgi:competence protein ComEA